MATKKTARLRRANRLRTKVKKIVTGQDILRLSVYKTPRHIYAQIIGSDGKVLTAVSTLSKEIRQEIKNGGNIEAAKVIGKQLAAKMSKIEIGNQKIVFDRSGFKYHGRVKALADAAREGGMKF